MTVRTEPSGRSNLRQRHREQTVGLIVDAFCELSLINPRFTMQELADEAGISVRTLYRYFPSRDSLVDGMLDVVNERLGPEHHAAVGSMEPGSEEMVRRSFAVFGEHDRLMRAVVGARVTGALSDPSHDVRSERILSGVSTLLDGRPDVVKRQLAGLMRLIGGSVSWMTLTDGTIDLSTEEAGDAAAWALRLLVAAAHDAGEYLE